MGKSKKLNNHAGLLACLRTGKAVGNLESEKSMKSYQEGSDRLLRGLSTENGDNFKLTFDRILGILHLSKIRK